MQEFKNPNKIRDGGEGGHAPGPPYLNTNFKTHSTDSIQK